MSVVVDNYNVDTYSLVLNSYDKISGTNNNATFDIDWTFLPKEVDRYKCIYTFQSVGGYYTDGSIQVSQTTNGSTASGATNITLSGVVGLGVGMTLSGSVYTPANTTISAIAGNVITLSNATTSTIPTATSLKFYSTINYSAARVVVNFGTRTYSYDTMNKSPSLTLGIVQRDIQTSTSKSNTLSAFYCQNPPRMISRPNQSNLTVQIFNNSVFSGGALSYSSVTTTNNVQTGTIGTYSTTNSNKNFLTDTDISGYTFASTYDMTPWTMLIEFIPVK